MVCYTESYPQRITSLCEDPIGSWCWRGDACVAATAYNFGGAGGGGGGGGGVAAAFLNLTISSC